MRLRKVALVLILLLSLSVMLALAVTGNVDKKEYVCMMQDMVLGQGWHPDSVCRKNLLRLLRDVQGEDQERTAKIHSRHRSCFSQACGQIGILHL